MFISLRTLVTLGLYAATALGAPVGAVEDDSNGDDAAAASVAAVVGEIEALAARATTTLSASTLAGFAPYTQLARAAYCPPAAVKGWSCGQACNAVQGFTVSLNGGDGNQVQYYYVGTWPEKRTIVVGHQGTDPTQFLSVATDINAFLTTPDSKLFPGLPLGTAVHNGFRDAHAATASIVLAEVKRLLGTTGYTSVTTVGHSLGGAIAELDALMFALNLPGKTVKAVTYGTPRVGNDVFARFLDSKVPDFRRINNDDDPVPIVPGRFLGYTHPKGEVHMLRTGYAVACDGNDNETDELCQIKSVPTIFQGNVLNHLGPYEGIWIGTTFCT